ncbi:unnamed protein product [Polarella glacialis]|uniref:Uncharacterized protein n=1 Tax=Polarella glacialis TaxID=89957 RepID=A0A813IC06_POLGL|nr:unnamed protein product [Polarella glacialis]
MCRHQTLAWRQVPPGYSALVCGCRNCSAVCDAGRLLGLSLDLAELSGCLALSLSRTRADAERPELASWEQQLAVPSASTYYDAHDMPALSSSRIWHATRKHGFYHGFAINLDLSLLLRTLGKYRRG